MRINTKRKVVSKMPVPLGYKIEKGKAVIDEVQAEQIKIIYSKYISGLSYIEAAKAAGVMIRHTGVRNILMNKRYLGDDYYPAIIDQETFDRAEAERISRQTKTGKLFIDTQTKETALATKFYMPRLEKKFEDPFKQAEYIYSLIEVEK